VTFEVQQTRWDRIIRRVSGSIGPGSRVSETLSELFPVIDVENVPGELLILGGTRTCTGGGTVALAANVPKSMLFNPIDSGIIATITRVRAATLTNDTFRWGFTNVQFLPVVGTQIYTDTRDFATAVCQISQLGSLVLASASSQIRAAANVGIDLRNSDGLGVLAPGQGMEMGATVLGGTLYFTYYWRERPALESELQF